MIRGKKNTLKIPSFIYLNKIILKWYLVGLFDADGTLPRNPQKTKQHFIDLCMKNKDFIFEIKRILKIYFDIDTLKIYVRKSKSPTSNKDCIAWEIRIRKKRDLQKFLKEIGFNHFDKKRRSRELLQILHG